MRGAGLLTALVLAGCAAEPVRRPVPAVDHVVVVSIDGLRPDFYRGDWDAPVLKEMARSGGQALAVESVYPSTTYPAHATIVTGVRPARHGITANTTWSDATGTTRDWYWFARSLKARTLWQAAREAGKRVAITYWPTSVGADADWVLGEIWDPEGKETVKRLVQAASPGLLLGLALEVGIPASKIAEDRASIDDFVSKAAAAVFRRHRPDLQLVHLLQVDEAQHKHGPDAPEVREALRRQDANIDRIRRAIAESGVGDRTLLLVVGDHGFTRVERNLNPNALLRDAGYIEVKDGKIDRWRALIRASGGSAGVYVRDPAEVPAVRDLFRSHSEGRYRVIERPRLDELGYNPEAAFALEPEPGWAIVGALAPGLVHGTPTVKGNHGQLPDRPGLESGLLAEGPAVRSGVVLDRVHLLDIAPTVAAVLGLRMDAVEGRVLRDLFR